MNALLKLIFRPWLRVAELQADNDALSRDLGHTKKEAHFNYEQHQLLAHEVDRLNGALRAAQAKFNTDLSVLNKVHEVYIAESQRLRAQERDQATIQIMALREECGQLKQEVFNEREFHCKLQQRLAHIAGVAAKKNLGAILGLEKPATGIADAQTGLQINSESGAITHRVSPDHPRYAGQLPEGAVPDPHNPSTWKRGL